ncbi:unnamed protein product [Prunus brigantina]
MHTPSTLSSNQIHSHAPNHLLVVMMMALIDMDYIFLQPEIHTIRHFHYTNHFQMYQIARHEVWVRQVGFLKR